jgi:formylmethanofuran dehydrogenase subunit E
MHNPILWRDDDFRADQLTPVPCFVPVTCAACGATLPEHEAELIDGMLFCRPCAIEYRRIEGMCK